MEPVYPTERVKVIIPTRELEIMILPYIGRFREEGFHERTLLEWSLLAWNEVETHTLDFERYYRPTNPTDAISEFLHDILVKDQLLAHLSNEDSALFLRDAHRVCLEGYGFFAHCLANLGLDRRERNTFLIDNWLSDSLVLDIELEK